MEEFINIQINLVNSISNRDKDGFIGNYAWATVPNKDEVINIGGNPYMIIERAWAISKEDENIFCYLRVWPLFERSEDD